MFGEVMYYSAVSKDIEILPKSTHTLCFTMIYNEAKGSGELRFGRIPVKIFKFTVLGSQGGVQKNFAAQLVPRISLEIVCACFPGI